MVITSNSKYYVVLVLSLMISSCNHNQGTNNSFKKNIENKSIQPDSKIPAKKVKREQVADSINSKNSTIFLNEYGKGNKETLVLLKTRLGNIKILLYEDTPIHRANFIFLTKVGYFNTTCFYRVVPDFIIQGGNSERMKTISFRNRYHNYRLPAEFKTNRTHKYGAVAAARDWENNPNKSSTPFEFYIIQNKEGGHHLDGEHTVFGEVISGFSVIDKIANLKAGGDEWPINDVFMEVEVLN